jgi:hypothetical protein
MNDSFHGSKSNDSFSSLLHSFQHGRRSSKGFLSAFFDGKTRAEGSAIMEYFFQQECENRISDWQSLAKLASKTDTFSIVPNIDYQFLN